MPRWESGQISPARSVGARWLYPWAYVVVGVMILAVLAYERLRPRVFEPA